MTRLPAPVRIDDTTAECLVFTEKQGLLSSVAHDLKIRVTKFELCWDGEILRARFDPSSLRVVSALKRGREDPEALDPKDREKIEQSIVDDVLEADRHPTIGFRSTRVVEEESGFRIEGDLDLHGVTRRIATRARRRDERWTAEIPLHQPDYAIRPFTAMLGTLKVKPEVRVEISVPASQVPDPPLEP